MPGLDRDLIVAVATPPGQGGIGIVRLSGPGALRCAQSICSKPFNDADFANDRHQSRRAVFCAFVVPPSNPDSLSTPEQIDEGLAVWFPEGASFTGEEVVELHAHGSPVVLQRLLDVSCAQGARLARPGEFSERAFLQGRIDLAQAEAIADLIASTSVAAARAAMRSLAGEFSNEVNAQAEALAQLRIFLEAAIDFPDEEIEHLADGQVAKKIAMLREALAEIESRSAQGRLMNEGIQVALLGAPNAGKSSLLNALSGEDAAIVTDIPGTTRDLLKVDVVIDGLALRLIDSAGLRDNADEVERIGVERALQQARSADLIIEVVDAARLTDPSSSAVADKALRELASLDVPRITVMNKIDLVPQGQRGVGQDASDLPIWVSAVTGEGLDSLRQEIKTKCHYHPAEATYTARTRHLSALQNASAALTQAAELLKAAQPLEIIAEELLAAHQQLGEIVGTVTPDDLLGRIFSEFCIGK